jgi:hypothetical protein
MIDVQPYIDRLELLKEVMSMLIDGYYNSPIVEEKNISWAEYYKQQTK